MKKNCYERKCFQVSKVNDEEGFPGAKPANIEGLDALRTGQVLLRRETCRWQCSVQDKEHPRYLIPELCKQFYPLGWVSGIGGGEELT